MDTIELLRKVRKVEIKTKKLSNHIFGGEYHSTFKGRGMTFSEVREYQFGDSIRNIDWNVTARYNKPFVKIFEEERELTMMLVVDISDSTLFGSSEQLKKEIITELSATLSFSATQNNDKVGLILFSNQIELYIPPKKGRSHVLRIIRELLEFKPKGNGTDLSVALDFLNCVIKKKSIVFLLSDFICKDYEKALQITSKRHDVNGFRIFDRREQQISNIGLVEFYELESGVHRIINTRSEKDREQYTAHYQQFINYHKKCFSKSNARCIDIETDNNYISKLYSFFKSK